MPAMPTLTIEDLGGGSARFTVAGSSAGSSTAIFARLATATAWDALPVATIAGDGSADVALDPGPYLAKAQSTLSGSTVPASNEPALFFLQDPDAGPIRSEFGDQFRDDVMPEMIDYFGQLVTYLRGVQSVEVRAMQGDVVVANDPATGVDVSIGDASWEILVDQLDFGAGAIVPKAQDQIITSIGEIFVVVESGVMDSEQMMWTIPVKRSEYKEIP